MTLFVRHLDAMQPLDAHFSHFIGNRMFSIPRKAIHASAHQEMRANCFCSAKELVNIALQVADVNAAFRIVQKGRGLLQILQPADAFFLFNRHARGIDFLLESVAAYEFASRPELHSRQAQGQSIGGHRQAGMHLNSAHNVVLQLSVQVPSHGKSMQNANRADVLPVIGKFRRIVKDQNSGIRSNESLVCRLEVSSKNVLFVHAVVGQKTIGCFCVCPVLANQRNALAGALGELLEKFSESLVEPDVCELATNKFTFNPCLGLGGGVINPR
ncbi:MAG TPA: hypothetical protein VIW93_07755 [Candidatus Acidoferrum sp.]